MALNHRPQLALPLDFDQSAHFENFYGQDQFIVDTLKSQINNPQEFFILIKGEPETGKTHLLQAMAAYCKSINKSFTYIHAPMLSGYAVEDINFDKSQGLILIDDVQALANQSEWERKLYDLYNQAQAQGFILVLSLLIKEQGSFKLKDWVSRMQSGLQITLPQLDDNGLKSIIRLKVESLGLELSNEVITFLFNHFPRSLNQQMKLIDELATQSLAQKRKLSILFVKEIFGSS